ncbi:uncharacterized protein LOC131948997 [Physella acuta]|uniref:uncharacterized protein LOC131948997 n=1 Tax=Physella acuta TaxID=109671 RepID=UPI0027DE5806|nr:uncharacterized protein LOC131948997 [Physella acuta]
MDSMNSILYWIYCIILLLIPLIDGSFEPEVYSRSKRAYRNAKQCTFPEAWRGKWYQSGVRDIEIHAHNISTYGHCISHDGKGKYLLLNRNKMCNICLVMTSKHQNVLQYKQSFCLPGEPITSACGMITGDFPLYTMIKVTGAPIPCPFQGQYEFSYTNGSEIKCDNPMSSINACADNSKFLFHHQKCPALRNSNEKVEFFQCLATWDTGGDSYLYGRFSGPLLTDKESQYRCFMYSLYGSTGHMSMTADSTCQGLQTPTLGMNVFTLRHKHEKWPQPRCVFPDVFGSTSEWRDVNSRHMFTFNKRVDGFKVTDLPEPDLGNNSEFRAESRLKVTCIGEVDSSKSGKTHTFDILTYVTDDKCESNYRCVRITLRSHSIIDIQIGKPTEQTENACQSSYFSGTKKFVLLPGNAPPKACPMQGSHTFVHRRNKCTGQILVGCSNRDSEVEVKTECAGSVSVEFLQCYENWTDVDRIYVIAGHVNDLRKAADCLVFKVTPNGYELEADAECGNDRLKIMGQPVDFIINSANKQCPTGVPKTVTMHPALSQNPREPPRNNKKPINPPEIETPPGGKPPTAIINAENSSTRLSLSATILVWVVLVVVGAVNR